MAAEGLKRKIKKLAFSVLVNYNTDYRSRPSARGKTLTRKREA
jgi:hypothetical protein